MKAVYVPEVLWQYIIRPTLEILLCMEIALGLFARFRVVLSRYPHSNIEGGFEGDENIDNEPLFCDASGGEFTLAQNSPCVLAGEYGSNMGLWNWLRSGLCE